MNRSEYYGTAKIINRTPALTSDVESSVGDASHETHQAPAFDTCVSIVVESHCVRLIDADGRCAKYAIDGLVKAGIIKDDGPKYVSEVAYRQIKARSKAEEKTVITLEVVG